MEKTYSLWLLPEEDVSKKYQKVISELASTYHTQEFKPHITLIKNLELKEEKIISLASELIKWLEPINTKSTEYGYSDRWYRNLYVAVLNTPELLIAHNEANKIFEHNEESFMPHLSLVYGDLPLDEKTKITDSLQLLNGEFFILNKLVITEENEVWKEVRCYELK